jgi:hypothetical protein
VLVVVLGKELVIVEEEDSVTIDRGSDHSAAGESHNTRPSDDGGPFVPAPHPTAPTFRPLHPQAAPFIPTNTASSRQSDIPLQPNHGKPHPKGQPTRPFKQESSPNEQEEISLAEAGWRH